MEYKINSHPLAYTCNQEKYIGENIVMLQKAIDLTARTNWHANGFAIKTLFDPAEQLTFLANTKAQLIRLWTESGLNIGTDFQLDQYHTIANTQELHHKAIGKTKLLPVDIFPINIRLLEKRISALLNQNLVAHNPFDNKRIFHYRIIRPSSGDNNPLHRDIWLEDYDNCINLYIPIAGSNDLSALIIAPGSHLWPESKIERTLTGAFIEGQQFNVPAVTSIFGEVEFVRPNPKQGEVLIFSPYLIHGGAVNLNSNLTRISIEIRLWKQ